MEVGERCGPRCDVVGHGIPGRVARRLQSLVRRPARRKEAYSRPLTVRAFQPFSMEHRFQQFSAGASGRVGEGRECEVEPRQQFASSAGVVESRHSVLLRAVRLADVVMPPPAGRPPVFRSHLPDRTRQRPERRGKIERIRAIAADTDRIRPEVFRPVDPVADDGFGAMQEPEHEGANWIRGARNEFGKTGEGEEHRHDALHHLQFRLDFRLHV